MRHHPPPHDDDRLQARASLHRRVSSLKRAIQQWYTDLSGQPACHWKIIASIPTISLPRPPTSASQHYGLYGTRVLAQAIGSKRNRVIYPWHTVMVHVILFQPEIPPNTGNIIRLCVNTGAQLHLIHPLGFAWEDARLRRAGLDYHAWAHVQHHTSLQRCLDVTTFARLFAVSVKGTRPYTAVAYQKDDALLFGPESCGLPPDVLQGFLPDQVLRIPMQQTSRSINLSNAVAIVLYEAWRQQGFVGGR